MTPLAPYLSAFLREHLPRERGASQHTIASYAHCYRLLLTFAAERRELADGDLLFARGDPADGGFVVMSGTIRLAPRVAEAEPVRAGRSALIGQLALFVRGTRPTAASAGTLSCAAK